LLHDPVDDEFGRASSNEDNICNDVEPPENHPGDGESIPIVAPELPTLEHVNLGQASAPRNGRSHTAHLFDDKEVCLLSFNMEQLLIGMTVTPLTTRQPFTLPGTTWASSAGLLTASSILVMLLFVLLFLLELAI
jgi:hypothetical protein